MRIFRPAVITAALLLTSACDSGSNSSPGAPAGAMAFADENDITQLLVTGQSATDTAAYWNCSSRGETSSVENLHLRFWSDGAGFSGSYPTTWTLFGDDGVQVDYAGGGYALENIEFSSLEQSADVFTASDVSGDSVWCQRFGPLRGEAGAAPSFNDPTLGLLESQLINPVGTTWNCREQDASGASFDTRYEFLPGTRVTLDGRVGRWHVDERYTVVLAFDSEVLAIRDVRFNGDAAFNAFLFGRTLDCALD